ncbi:tRNA (adenosine(37)-N6)-threonylcarbamoyltransferase complex transferase subunit TsaD, partial [Candidatus Peregrinibacteria bacterium]|nr:tRNA (adenosine(37)-N6)-threonylcarbamoyltransferase complex transferase subunit TsaD [Candidatus Peregrinibacteria bacterium]
MRILGIETSCDETAAAVVEDGIHVLSNVIASAKDAFLWSGGVIPEEAARKQVECVLPIIAQTLSEAHITHEDLDAIAVTKGTGLLGTIIVGTETPRILAAMWHKPLIGIHHHFGHLSSTWLRQKSEARGTKHETISDFGFRISDLPCFPILTLTVSGGHT